MDAKGPGLQIITPSKHWKSKNTYYAHISSAVPTDTISQAAQTNKLLDPQESVFIHQILWELMPKTFHHLQYNLTNSKTPLPEMTLACERNRSKLLLLLFCSLQITCNRLTWEDCKSGQQWGWCRCRSNNKESKRRMPTSATKASGFPSTVMPGDDVACAEQSCHEHSHRDIQRHTQHDSIDHSMGKDERNTLVLENIPDRQFRTQEENQSK